MAIKMMDQLTDKNFHSDFVYPNTHQDHIGMDYSETCLRQSPFGPDQLAVIQRWPAFKDCIEN